MRFVLSITLTWLGIASARADDPMPEEKLPAPRIIVAPPPAGGNLFLPAAPILYQHGTRDVWQNYAVDSSGRWRPRVILAPYGSYYYSNGQPYPWTTTHPRSFRAVTHD